MTRPLSRYASWGGLLWALASCSGESRGFNEQPEPAPLPPGECPSACSLDGRAIVDCKGEVLTACAVDSSCFQASCIDACVAAKAAQSSIGCEYFAAKPQARNAYFYGYDASCYAVLVANTWDSPVTLTVEYDGQPINSSYFRIPRGSGKDLRYELLPEGKLPKDELAVLFLAHQPPEPNGINDTYAPCPSTVGAAIIGQTEVRGSGYGKTFHVRSSAPIIAYDIYPYGGAATYLPSSSLLLPTSAWGTENFAMDGWSADIETAKAGALPYFQILAQENDTHVTLIPTTTLSSMGGAPERPKGQPVDLVLQRGQFVQYTQVGEVNGTPVVADKPIAVVGGNTCTTIPNQSAACDTLHQQLPPISLLGDSYVATRHRDREPNEPEETPWRILAAADGTTLTYDPPIAGAPAALNRGEWSEFWAPGPFVVKSQDPKHPIYVAAYMTAGSTVTTNDGDPEFVNVVPVGQYLSSYVFLTDPTYGNTNLVFVRTPTPNAPGVYEEVELDCVGTVTGWKRVGQQRVRSRVGRPPAQGPAAGQLRQRRPPRLEQEPVRAHGVGLGSLRELRLPRRHGNEAAQRRRRDPALTTPPRSLAIEPGELEATSGPRENLEGRTSRCST